jgi:hypothetical protein
MPDGRGLLTDDEIGKIQTWLRENGAMKCPACDYTKWTVGDRLVLAPAYNPNGPTMAGSGFPAVLLVCDRCAYYRLHSAILMSIIPFSVVG